MEKKPDHLGELRKIIEQQLGWGNSEEWAQQDFRTLSEQVFEQTSVQISVTTLKRVWGKVTYRSQPATQTLNALAVFAQFDSWQQFKGSLSDALPVPRTAASGGKERSLPKIFMLVLLAAVAAAILWAYTPDLFASDNRYGASIFESQPVTEGLPNTVIFSYRFDKSPEQPVSIQQSWDSRLRHTIDPKQETFTCTYYYPGYFRAKLMVEEAVVQEHDVYVPSDGWLGVVEAEPIPYYLSADLNREGKMAVSASELEDLSLLGSDKTPVTSYILVKDLGDISGSDFQLETAVQQTYPMADAICQTTEIRVLCTKGHFQIPVSIPGCVGTLSLWMSEKRIGGESADLSAFGADMSQWQHIRLEVQDKEVAVYLGNQLIFEDEFEEDPGKVVGIRYRFLGSGAVDYVRLRNGAGMMVLEDEFE